MNKNRCYYRIKRYRERKKALENLKVNFMLLLGIKRETLEEMKERHEKQVTRLYLESFICDLLFERNPYKEKQRIKNCQILTRWFEYYNLKSNLRFIPLKPHINLTKISHKMKQIKLKYLLKYVNIPMI